MKRFCFRGGLLSIAILILSSFQVRGQGVAYRNECVFGAGDPLAEALFYRPTPHKDYSAYNPDVKYLEKQSFHYVPHFFLEYYYNFKSWLGVGGQIDIGSFYWKNVYYRGGSNVPVETVKQNNFNVSILPSVRFAYLRKEHVRLFSTVRIGMDINSGSELDYKGRNTAVGFCFSPTWIGVSYLNGHWFGSFELGSMFALADLNEIFMAGSKLFSLSVGYRF